jgi:hypothetical protein
MRALSIQPDLQFKKRGGDIQLIAFAECTPESLVFDQISSGKKQRILATHALQFLFLGFTGFRFPCAHFPSTTASGYELYLLLWEAVNMLSSFWVQSTIYQYGWCTIQQRFAKALDT